MTIRRTRKVLEKEVIEANQRFLDAQREGTFEEYKKAAEESCEIKRLFEKRYGQDALRELINKHYQLKIRLVVVHLA